MTKRDPERTRRALLDAAAELFDAPGYYATNTNLIARGAGYSPQTFYRHFPDKRAIFLVVYEEWAAALLTKLRRVEERSATTRERARAWVKVIVDHHKRHAVFRASLLALDATDDDLRERRRLVRKAWFEEARATLGCAKNADPLLLELIWSTERIADGLARDEAKAFGVNRRAVLRVLEDRLVVFLQTVSK